MDWFEMRVGFHSDEKVLALRQALGNHEADAFVSRIYAHCYLQEQGRFAAAMAPAVLERAAEWRGKTGRLVTALVEAGFLDREGDDLVVHGVEQRLQKMRGFRQAAAERQQRAREKRNRDVTPLGHAPVTGDVTRDSRVGHGTPTDRPTDRPGLASPAAPPAEQIPDGGDGSLGPGPTGNAAPSPPRWPLLVRFNRGTAEGSAKTPLPIIGREARAEESRIAAEIESELARVGVEFAIAIAVERVRDGAKPKTLSYWLPMLRDLETPAPQRAPGECPKPGDPDFNDEAAWPSMQAFYDRDARARA